MPIKPAGSILTFTSSETDYPVVIEDIQFQFNSEFFQRAEFEHNKLRSAKNTDGSIPIYITLFAGKIVQLTATCSGSVEARPLTPDDDSVDDINQRFDIKRYTIKGGPSLAANVDALYSISVAHKVFWDRFQGHQQAVSLDISYDDLVTLQAEDFSYLTTVDLTMAGNSLASTESNMLIRSFNVGVEYEIPAASGPSTLYKSWSMVVENITIVPADSESA